MKKKTSYFILLAAGVFTFSELLGAASGTVAVSLRPSHVCIKSDTSQGAVLIKLSGYSTDEVKYRLFNGSTQYACWSSLTNTYITSSSYSSGPIANGLPSVSSSFWIMYQRGTNSSTTASYRDRLGPDFSSNNNTAALPAATAITDSFIISGKLSGSEINSLSQKFVILAWSGASLVCATSSNLNTGIYSILLPKGIIIDKIEVRTLDNLSIAEVNGNWSAFVVLSAIQLVDNPKQDSKLRYIKIDGADFTEFNPKYFNYTVELPKGSTEIPFVEVKTENPDAIALVYPANDLSGDAAARTTTIEVTASNGTSKKIYKILFTPLVEVETLAEFRTRDTSGIYVITAELLISYMNTYRNQIFIQDSSGAVMIDDPELVISTKYKIGDIISNLKVKLEINSGITELIPLEDPGGPVSSGNEVVPEIITLDQIYSNTDFYENKFVKIMKVKPFDAGALIAPKANYSISDGVNLVLLSTRYDNLDYVGTPLPGLFDISGILSIINSAITITPRYISDFHIYSSNSLLSGIFINGKSLSGFDPGITEYAFSLPFGTFTAPVVSFSVIDTMSSSVFYDAANLYGNEDERTAKVIVTAEDGISRMIYSITFTVDISNIAKTVFDPGISIFPVPVIDELTIHGLSMYTIVEIMDITGTIIINAQTSDPELNINVSNLKPGLYFLKTAGQTLKFIKQ